MAISEDESTVDKTQTSEPLSVDEINKWKKSAAQLTPYELDSSSFYRWEEAAANYREINELDDERDRAVDQANAIMSTLFRAIVLGPVTLYFFLFYLLVVQPIFH